MLSSDGTGGCDGCLNWKGVGARVPNNNDPADFYQFPPANLTDNNGLENLVMALESLRARSGVLKSMRNRVVKTGAKHFDQETLNQRLIAAGWDGLKDKEIAFFYS